jgi:hypothetical protein
MGESMIGVEQCSLVLPHASQPASEPTLPRISQPVSADRWARRISGVPPTAPTSPFTTPA